MLGIAAGRSRTKQRHACTAPTGWDAAGPPDARSRRATAPTRASVLALARADPALAEPIVPGLAYSQAEVVYAVRAEMARTVDDVLSRRTRARLLARDASAAAAARRRRADGRRARLGRRRARPPGRAVPRARSTPNERRGGLPETALDALLAADRRSSVVCPRDADEPGRADAAHRVRGRRRRRPRPADGRRVEVDDAARERARARPAPT